MHTVISLKAEAKRLRAHLKRQDIPLNHGQALESIAAVHGFKDWNTASATVQNMQGQDKTHEEPSDLSWLSTDLRRHYVQLMNSFADKVWPHLEQRTAIKMFHLDGLQQLLDDKLVASEQETHIRRYLYALPGYRYGHYERARPLHELLMADWFAGLASSHSKPE